MDSLVDNETLSTLEGAGSCPKAECRYVLPRLRESAPVYFKQGFVTCGHCGDRVDLWQAAVDRATRMSSLGAWALCSLGAAQTSFVMSLETGKYYSVELMNYGVPADAKILKRGYTGQGGDVTAMEWHGNAPPLRFPGTVLRLVGVPLGEGPLPRVGRVAINTVWVRHEDSDEWSYLVTAFESAAAGDYAPSLVFAQSAVEISMMPLIEQKFRRHASAEHVKNFMRDSLSYSHALNVVLPNLCAEAGLGRMPDVVRGSLNKMRKKRNDIIHEGTEVAAVTAQDAMEGLCAAAFGFEYMRYVGPILLEGKK
jgi:hypothetical protein